MDWMEEVRARMKRKNQILFAKNSAFLQDLIALIEGQSHRAVVLWAFELAGEAVQTLRERYPDEQRPDNALSVSTAWAFGEVRMPVAQQAILQVHALAKELDSPEDIALCHAIGQACGTVHTSGHAIGFPIYELTAIIRRDGIEGCEDAVLKRKAHYIERLLYWQDNAQAHPGKWAKFMLEDERRPAPKSEAN